MISKSLCMITYIYLSKEDVWQTKGFNWLNVKQVIILCNYLIFYGYFYILSPLSNAQAQFGTRWRVTTSMLFHIQGASMSENDLYFSINVPGCSLERIIQIGSNYRGNNLRELLKFNPWKCQFIGHLLSECLPVILTCCALTNRLLGLSHGITWLEMDQLSLFFFIIIYFYCYYYYFK